MLKLILLGSLAGVFFSTTFVLNELMASQGGHWFWSASLRYVFIWLILSVMIVLRSGFGTLIELVHFTKKHYLFWGLAGGIGCGGFYAFLCFGANFAPGWVIAATFQSTIVASLIILACLGEKPTKKVIATSCLIFLGVILANLGEGFSDTNRLPVGDVLLFGALPALLAGFCLPIGNQMVWQATRPKAYHSLLSKIPHLSSRLMDSALHKVWLLSLGSFPFWLVLGLLISPPMPSQSQVFNTLLVGLFAGVIATSIFLFARSKAANGSQVAAVDATQATEMVFSLIGGSLLLATPMPSITSWIGIFLVALGVVLFSRMQA